MLNLEFNTYISINQLWYILLELQTESFSGTIEIVNSEENNWKMYFYLGRLLYATGGEHPVRRWTRHVKQSLSENFLKDPNLFIQEKEFETCWEYEIISRWCLDEKIKREQVIKIINGIIKEVFFDLYRVRIGSPEITHITQVFSQQWISDSVEQYILYSQQEWKLWQQKGIADINPEHKPVIKRDEELAAKISQNDYRKMSQFFKAKLTLRELSTKIQKSVLDTTVYILPYIRLGIIEMVEIEDWPSPFRKKEDLNRTLDTFPLIAYIDDNLESIENLNQQVEKLGCKFVGIQYPLQTISILLNEKPDLIIINLGISVTNGYEMCVVLRRMSAFKDTPIVILAQEDSLFNKIQAKLSGATDTIIKPDQLMKVFLKYVSPQVKTRSYLD